MRTSVIIMTTVMHGVRDRGKLFDRMRNNMFKFTCAVLGHGTLQH